MERERNNEKTALMREIGVPYLEVLEGSGAAVLLRALMAPALGERSLASGDEVILVGDACAAEADALALCGLVGVCVPANSGASDLEGALSPASKAVWVCADATAAAVCMARNFCNSLDLWMLASVTPEDTRSCPFDGKCYHVGAVADVATGALVNGAFVCTKDELPYQLMKESVKGEA
jgi:hypothetical protein